LDIGCAADALAVVAQVFDDRTIPEKTRLALDELLPPGQRPPLATERST